MTFRSLAVAAAFCAVLPPALAQDAAAPTPTPAPAQLEQITVIGVKGETDRVAGSAHRIGEQTLEQYRYDDISRILNFVPGVYVREEDGVGLRPNIGLRGASADRSQKVTLMEDGILIAPAPYSAPAAYFFPLSARMVGVEVFKGPASIQHGPQTIGGAVNLVSAPIPNKTEAMVDAALGSDGYRRLHVRGGSRWDGTGVMGEAVHIGSDGFKELDGGGDTGFSKNELLGKAAWNLGPGRLELRLSYADEVSDETYLGLTEDDFRAQPERRYLASSLDRMEWDWIGGRASWTQPLLGGTLLVTGYTQSFDRAWRKINNFNGADIRSVLANPDTPNNRLYADILRGTDTDGVAGSPDDLRIGTNHREFLVGGVQSELNWEFGSRVTHLLELGMRLHYDRIRRLHDEFGFEQTGGAVVGNGLPRTILVDNEASTNALALWLRDEIGYGKWTLVPGLRIETIFSNFSNQLSGAERDNDYAVVLPGLGVSYQLAPQLSVLAGVHRGFSPATPSLDPDTEPEESINYEAGGRWNGFLGRVELIAFYNDYSNLTATCTISSGCSPQDLDTQINAGKVETYGVEAGWNETFKLTSWLSLPVALTYTYTHAEFREAFSSTDPQFGNVEPGFELPYIPEHRGNASIGLAGTRWGTDLSLTRVSRMRDQAGAGDFAASAGSDAYTALDLAARYQLLPALTLHGRVDNLLDEEYVVSRRPYGARPGKPLSFQLGVSYNY